MSLSLLLNSYFSSYTKNYFKNSVVVLWYNQEFSQSRFPPGQTSKKKFFFSYFNFVFSNDIFSILVSEACTLICLLVAQRISQTGLLIYNIEKSPQFIAIIAEAMIEGNNIHAWIVKKGLVSHPYLSTEEALKLGGRNLNLLREWVQIKHIFYCFFFDNFVI